MAISTGVAGKGHAAGHHLEGHDPHGVDVGAGVEVLAEHLLRSHVARRPQREARLGEMHLLPGASGQPEVREQRAPVAVDEHVVGFEVAMDDARVVSVLEALAHLSQIAPGGGAVEGAAVEDVTQRAAANQRHGEEHHARSDHEVDDREDVGVVEAREGARLLLEPFDETLVRDEVGHQGLERDLAA
jgi:hypothetical protein